MKARTVIAVVAFIVIIGGGMVIIAWNSKPRLIDVFPQAGAMDISAASTIRMTFSRSMDIKSIEEQIIIEPAIQGTFQWETNILTFSPDHPWPSGQEIQLSIEAGAHAASWLSFPMDEYSWSFKVSEATLAYLWPSDGPAELYTLDPENGEIHQYTQGIDVLDYFASNDGSEIYFSASNTQDGADLYRINRLEAERFVETTYQPEKLLDCGVAQCRNPVVSYDDQYLAYEYILPSVSVGVSPSQIWILSLPDLEATPIGQTEHETVQPSWSSGGLLAYYDRTMNGYEVINLQSKERMLFPNQTGQPGVWSIDGDYYLAPEISYSIAPGNYETGISHLIRYKIPDHTSMDISGDDSVEDVEAVYSPDSRYIAFTRKYLDAADWTPGRQIWLMNADGTNAYPITNEADYNHYDLAWSRDGSMLAYVRFNQAQLSDLPELWMMNSDGSNPIQLVIGGYSPIWIP
ncbi:MAG: Ig-like domain-containing protein [Anaerolineales bacterium]